MELFRHKKKHSSKRERILKIFTWIIAIVGIALICMLGALLPHRLLVLLSGGLLLLSILSVVVAIKGKGNSRVVSWGLGIAFGSGLAAFVGFGYTVTAYSFYKTSFSPFWEVSLALGLAVGIFVTVKWVWKGTGWGGRIGSIALCTFLAYFLIWLPLCHLNYLLDFEPPAERQAVIEEKQVHRNAKSADTYEFEMTVDGEPFELRVRRREYNEYDVGDTYTFKEYKGAFGKPFCMAEE
jgi:hypothetical protein